MWIKKENELSFTASQIEALTEIPVGNWLLKSDPYKGLFLEETPKFKFPKKIYGDSEKIAKRYLNTFANQTNNLGILLTGLKGTGKSVTAKLTCDKSNMPVILITEPFTGDGFKSFLSNISQEAVIFVDEFEKVYYDVALQNSFLSILDGIFEGKKIFIFTSNDKNNINQYMINRPGRVHYLREYDALDASIINDVIEDNLKNKTHKTGLLEVLNILSNVTMDMLISLIKEMNLYNESAREAIRFLNLKPEKTSYDYDVYQNNIRIGGSYVERHPLTQEYLALEVWANDLTLYTLQGASNHDEIVATLDNFRNKNVHSLEDVSESVSESISPMSEGEAESVEQELIAQGFTGKALGTEMEKVEDKVQVKTPAKKAARVLTEQTPSGYVRYNLFFDECKVEYKDDEIIITDEHGARFVFSKRTYYTYSW